MIIDIPKVGEVEFPDSMSEKDINSAAKKLFDEANVVQKPTANRLAEIATRGAAPSVIGGLAGGAVAGAPGALVGSMALPVGDALNSFINMISGGVNKVAGTDIGQLQMPSQVVSNYMTQAGLAQPESRGERMIEAGASGIGSTLAQLPNLARLGVQAATPMVREVTSRLAEAPVRQAAISAPSAATAQYVAEATGSPIAGMIAGGTVGAAGGIKGRKAESAPTATELKDQATAAYKRSADVGALIKPEVIQNAGQRIVDKVSKNIIIDPEVDTQAAAVTRRLTKTFDEPQSFEQLDLTRQFIRDAQKGGGRDAKFANEALRQFDDFIDGIKKEDLIKTEKDIVKAAQAKIDNGANVADFLSQTSKIKNADSDVAIKSLKEARDLWKRSNKAQIVDDLLQSAELRAGNYSQSGMENSVRQRLIKLADSEDMKFFSLGEQEAIRAAAKGGKVQNVLRWMGKLSPSSVVAAGAGSYIGASMLGPAGAVIAPVVGFGAKQAATKMRMDQLQNLQDLIALGRAPTVDTRTKFIPVTGLRGLLSTTNQSE